LTIYNLTKDVKDVLRIQ